MSRSPTARPRPAASHAGRATRSGSPRHSLRPFPADHAQACGGVRTGPAVTRSSGPVPDHAGLSILFGQSPRARARRPWHRGTSRRVRTEDRCGRDHRSCDDFSGREPTVSRRCSPSEHVAASEPHGVAVGNPRGVRRTARRRPPRLDGPVAPGARPQRCRCRSLKPSAGRGRRHDR